MFLLGAKSEFSGTWKIIKKFGFSGHHVHRFELRPARVGQGGAELRVCVKGALRLDVGYFCVG